MYKVSKFIKKEDRKKILSYYLDRNNRDPEILPYYPNMDKSEPEVLPYYPNIDNSKPELFPRQADIINGELEPLTCYPQLPMLTPPIKNYDDDYFKKKKKKKKIFDIPQLCMQTWNRNY